MPDAQIDARTDTYKENENRKDGRCNLLPRHVSISDQRKAQSCERQSEKAKWRFHGYYYREEVPPSFHSKFAQQVAWMAPLVVLIDCTNARGQLNQGQW